VKSEALSQGRYPDRRKAAFYDDAARREFGEFARPSTQTGG